MSRRRGQLRSLSIYKKLPCLYFASGFDRSIAVLTSDVRLGVARLAMHTGMWHFSELGPGDSLAIYIPIISLQFAMPSTDGAMVRSVVCLLIC